MVRARRDLWEDMAMMWMRRRKTRGGWYLGRWPVEVGSASRHDVNFFRGQLTSALVAHEPTCHRGMPLLWMARSLTTKSLPDGKAGFAASPGASSKCSMDAQTVYNLLKLSKFTKSEIEWRFDRIVKAGHRMAAGRPSALEASISKQHQLASHGSDNLQSSMLLDMPSISLEPILHIEHLEAYLFERYLHMEDQWNAKHYHNNFENLEIFDDETNGGAQMQQQLHAALEIHQRQQERITRIRDCARKDAISVFQLIMPHAPPECKRPMQSIPSTIDNDPTTCRSHSTTLTKHQFYTAIHALSSQINYPTILPLAASMLLVGSSVGVISPIMPFLASKLDLTTYQYGIVVSSFALSKMLGNVPSAILVERHGRKPYLVHSLWLVGLGVAGLGLSSDWVQLSLCRMTIGLGVAALTTASTLTVADVSTPLSRASTFSPVMSAFAGGTALGPALGGILCDEFGIRDTFLMVAASYGAVGVWNSVSLRETGRSGFWLEGGGGRLPWHNEEGFRMNSSEGEEMLDSSGNAEKHITVSEAIRDTINQWSSLLNDQRVRPIVIMNGFYLCAISGTQMCLLPLLLTGGGANATATGMALTATAMGQVYMWMSAVQVLGNPAAGRFADKAGKHTAIVAGGILSSTAIATVPVICAYGLMVGDYVALDANDVNWPLLVATLGIWSLGGTLLATSHVAAISDAVSDSRRSQAIALLRTAGDVGFLCGAAGAGLAADIMGDVGFAMQAGSAVLMGATGWFGLQTLALHRVEGSRKE
ncbi:hypothetical protein HJC23_011821 [Cyclotella cryptica]|uniref:Major facilitator superfamily (MFS) profile domain-containing protein n=1 Tax=Cyclotella cryptica TaxID=29204 RepID=A0ABD3NVT4_9STRA|eukprot:CCRYP_019318-RA/>CCRYP_019318-RA protein AED:0.25 eAED:0.25 QI:268/1/1/1/1/1/2/2339/763